MITISWDHLTIHFDKCDMKEWLNIERQADKPRQFDEEGEQNDKVSD